ncbi:MAG: class I SAM-dependent methyltransferase [Aquabacterium sp.]
MDKQRANAFMSRLVGDVATTLAATLLLVGDRLQLFRAMADAGPLSPAGLAERAGIAERYAEEWLAVMAGAGYVDLDPATGAFTLPPEHAQFLIDPNSEYYLAGLFRGLPTMAAALPALTEAFKSGGGLPFEAYGAELPEALAAMNRSVYNNRLARDWLPKVPGLVERLAAGGRALDIGCGAGVVPIAIQRAFPQAQVMGIDTDRRSIELARAAAQAATLTVQLETMGVEDIPTEPGWDFISTFDVIHDLPDPPAALRRIRQALAPGGTYLMVEPKVSDQLHENLANPFARMLYGISCLHCVPQSLALGGPGLGACWGERRARALAQEAGFGAFDRLDIRSPALAFYALQT